MIAFWKHDTFPYVLSAKVVGDIRRGGMVEVEGFGGMLVKPISLLNDEEGFDMAGRINAVKIDYQIELDDFNSRHMRRLREVAPDVMSVALKGIR